MNKRLAALLSASLLAVGFFTLPAWTQQPSKAPDQGAQPAKDALPASFDLLRLGGVTPVKKQQGGTCWTHGTMAAIESNLIVSGKWKEMKMPGIPMLSEYHLDWWNGFNQNFNEDLVDASKDKSGLKPHVGGDYRVATAYISRGDGVIVIPGDPHAVREIAFRNCRGTFHQSSQRPGDAARDGHSQDDRKQQGDSGGQWHN